MADPDIVSDGDGILAAPVEEALLALGVAQ